MVANPNMLRAAEQGASNIDLSRVIWDGSEMAKTKSDIDAILDSVTYSSGETQEEILANATSNEPALVSVVPEGNFNTDFLEKFKDEIAKSNENLSTPGVREELLKEVLSNHDAA